MSKNQCYGTLYITDLADLTLEQNDYMNKHYKIEINPTAKKILNDTPKQKINFAEIYGDVTINSFNIPIVEDNSTENDVKNSKNK